MPFGYDNGYFDALRDVFCWFSSHKHLFQLRSQRLVLAILEHLKNNQEKFSSRKECYEFDLPFHDGSEKDIVIGSEMPARQPQASQRKPAGHIGGKGNTNK